MLKRNPLVLAATLAVVSLAHPADAPDPSQILRAADLTRGGWDSFGAQLVIVNQTKDRTEEHRFEVLIKGTDRSLVRFMNPRDKGRQLLMLGDDMWIFLPNTQRPVRITPLQRLVGNASNGDVARTRYEEDYTPALIGQEEAGGEMCHVLELVANRKAATYQKVHLWVGVASSLPRRADFFLASGRRYKTATFDEYTSVSGQRLLARMTINDLTGEGTKTTMIYSGYAVRELSDKIFNKTAMGK